jgi:hypothetical protein
MPAVGREHAQPFGVRVIGCRRFELLRGGVRYCVVFQADGHRFEFRATRRPDGSLWLPREMPENTNWLAYWYSLPFVVHVGLLKATGEALVKETGAVIGKAIADSELRARRDTHSNMHRQCTSITRSKLAHEADGRHVKVTVTRQDKKPIDWDAADQKIASKLGSFLDQVEGFFGKPDEETDAIEAEGVPVDDDEEK